jgi:RNA polymerase sigma factor (sigma-70 family)
MATRRLTAALQRLRWATLLRDGDSPTGSNLLERFLRQRDEVAFEALVRRHGPMVLGVCRRVLRNEADAEDAFQATFLVLVRKAASVRPRGMVGNWLYGVARNTALKARDMIRRRQAREREAGAMSRPAATGDVGRHLQTLLDEELPALPDKYRAPVVLCDLEGKTVKEAARQLGWPQGTLATRLRRGRALLAKRLVRHGLTYSGAGVAAALAGGAAAAGVPAPLVTATVEAATAVAAGKAALAGVVAAPVAALTEGVLKVMLLTKLKNAGLVLLAAVALGAAAAGAAYRAPAEPRGAQPEAKPGVAGARATETGPPKAASGTRFENAPHWSWYYHDPRPRGELGSSMSLADVSGRGLSAIVETDKDGGLRVYLAYRETEAALRYRPVAFDSQRKRYALAGDQGTGHRGIALVGFRLDPRVLPAAKAEYLGFEYLSREGRKAAAREAAGRARKAGVEVLPWPEVGQPYDFVLTTPDGKKVRGHDWRGKVVLIDCWATWCSPCMAKMPQLQELYAKHHAAGLEVVGVCWDQDGDKGRKAAGRLGLAWPQVYVPAKEKARALWTEASGIESLPRLLLIDRDGVLRADCGPGELKDQIARLLARTPAKESKP